MGNQHPNIVPYQVFAASDGHLIVAAGNDAQYGRFCRILGREDLIEDARFARNIDRIDNRDEIVAILAKEIATWEKDALVAEMEAQKVPGGPINRLSEVFASDQVAARGMKIDVPDPDTETGSVPLIGNPVKFSATPVRYRRPPPACGADNAALEGLWEDE